MTPQERADALARLEEALARADAVAMVLRLAAEDLRANADDQQAANVARFASSFVVRQCAMLAHRMIGIP